MNKAPHEDGAGKEYLNALDQQYSTPPVNNCKSCGIPTHSPLCPTCYRWRVHFNAVQQAMWAIQGDV